MPKCARTACQNEADDFIHVDTGLNYCVSCARKINEYQAQTPDKRVLVESPADIRARQIKRLAALRGEISSIEKEFGITPKDQEVVNDEMMDDERIVVVADGLGGADLHHVAGHWPIDYHSKHERHYDKEEDACSDAARIGASYQGETPEDKDEAEDWNDVMDAVFPKKEKPCKSKPNA